MDGTRWIFTKWKRADLTRASLRQCRMLGVTLEGSIFREADLTGADVDPLGGVPVYVLPVDFTDADLTGARITLTDSVSFILTRAKMGGCRISKDSGSTRCKKAVFDLFLSSLINTVLLVGLTGNGPPEMRHGEHLPVKGRHHVYGKRRATVLVHLRTALVEKFM